MKKIVLLTAALIMTASMAYAAGSSIISGTKHNLSSGGQFGAQSPTSQICIFCHTPHNAAQKVPLWNRANPAGNLFKLYTSSATLTAATKASAFQADSISLFCMSCHDGATTLGGSVVKYGSGAIGAVALKVNAADQLISSANLGRNLTDDHPVAFDYTQAASADTSLVASPIAKIAFFKSGAIQKSLECASCHKVHDNTEEPFLRTTKAGSALCLACHIK